MGTTDRSRLVVNVCWGAILKAGLPVDTPLLANLTRKGVDIWVVRAFWGEGLVRRGTRQ